MDADSTNIPSGRSLLRALVALAIVLTFVGLKAARRWPPSGLPRNEPASADPDRLEPFVKDDPFTYAKVSRTDGPPPARFAAPIPSKVPITEESWATGPPQAHVHDLLCAGDSDMENRTLAAIRLAAGGRASGQDIGEAFAGLVEGCEARDYCTWARAQASVAMDGEAEPPAVREALLHVLASCGDVADSPIVELPDVPPRAIVRWHEARSMRRDAKAPTSVPPASLVRAVMELARTGDVQGLEGAAHSLAWPDSPERSAAMVAVHAAAADASTKHAIAMAMSHLSAPDARAIFEEACRANPDAVQCRRRSDPSTVERRLREALPAPAGVATADTEPKRDDVAAQATFDRLVALGLLAADATLPAEIDRAADMLEVNGAAVSFDIETGTWPNEHDSLCRRLARLVAPELDGVLFEEIPAPMDSGDPYRVVAHADGHQVTVLAADLGDWWDVDAAVGLVNSLLRDRSSPRRLLVVDVGGGQVACVVGGSDVALRAAMGERVLTATSAMSMYEASIEFERRVIEALGGGTVE